MPPPASALKPHKVDTLNDISKAPSGPGSWLLLRVGLASAGNYSCSTHQSNRATVTIIVVQGQLALLHCTGAVSAETHQE